MIKIVYLFPYSNRYSCTTLMKLNVSRHIFEKNFQISNFIKFRPM